jgi:hypothetical protein
MSKYLPLKSQPGSFWLGATMVSEVSFAALARFLSGNRKETIIDFIMSGALGIATFLTAIAVSIW